MISIEELEEFDNHSSITFLYSKKNHLKGFIALHRNGSSVPSFGATRLLHYTSELDALKDVLKLSRTMSYKIALAGLQYGGAKAVLFDAHLTQQDRGQMFKSYARHVSMLNGKFLTGADVGVDREEVKLMHRLCPYMVGIFYDPVRFTALGVSYAIEVCLKELNGNESLEGTSIAIQGMGKVGTALLKLIYSKAAQIYIADINLKAVKDIKVQYPRVTIVSPDEIHKQPVDFYSPCALSSCLNLTTINELRCKAVIGAANGQLESKNIGDKLHKYGILYGPDYVVNAGGLISVVDEYEYEIQSIKRVTERVKTIKNTFNKIIEISKSTNKPTSIVADDIAGKRIASLV